VDVRFVGSTARNEARHRNDIDLRIDCGYLVGRGLDLLMLDALRPELRERIFCKA
jgi:predicted nucleotidyltransferase